MATRSELEILINQVLVPVGRSEKRINETEVVAKAASRGRAYSGGLMVIGRAVNGWSGLVKRTALSDPSVARAAVAEDASWSDSSCPMGWVKEQWSTGTKYNTAKSAFWRVIRRVMVELMIVAPDTTDWATHLVWSNLYKVAPDGGKPSGQLRGAQIDGCIALLREELRVHRPTRVLFLTGTWANAFLSELPWTPSTTILPASQLLAAGRLGDAQAVVASHPQGKPEDPWVSEVVGAFGRI